MGRGGLPLPRSGCGGTMPHSEVWMGGGTPFSGLDAAGGTQSRSGLGTPHRQSSIASTCSASGGMPLKFTQEDFIVSKYF